MMWTIDYGDEPGVTYTATLHSAAALVDLVEDFKDSGTVWHKVTGPDIDGMDASEWLSAMTMD